MAPKPYRASRTPTNKDERSHIHFIRLFDVKRFSPDFFSYQTVVKEAAPDEDSMHSAGLYLDLVLFSHSSQVFWRCNAEDQFCYFCPQPHIRSNVLVLIGCSCSGVSHSNVQDTNWQIWMGSNKTLPIPREEMDHHPWKCSGNDWTGHLFT